MTILLKTELGRAALQPGARLLTPRERTIVLLADGQRSVRELCTTVAGADRTAIMSLVLRGFLQDPEAPSTVQLPDATSSSPKTSSATAATTSAPTTTHSAWMSEPDQPRPEPTSRPIEWQESVRAAFRQLEPLPVQKRIRWARTPAATKLYLMDVAERTFAGSDLAQWERLRDILREVRDEDSLAVAMDVVTHAVGRVAGAERAQALRDRLQHAN